ncbi:Aste57867_9092 [Aphanomyces stellatus]|uniref:Aste57867_9092 protein n=1 Tax=Aphanomyces stellatus TaxID=120398 RepID=A0A485KLZ5_9STRA|nr:hypothetical protein As57867_009056 [Aphanomyces stellatus]VFT85976.1 Aste57867_9092 [Aphanomyces stellatus]
MNGARVAALLLLLAFMPMRLTRGDGGCVEDYRRCPDGRGVGRDPANKCQFFPCNVTNATMPMCPPDVFQCPWGLKVPRDPDRNCSFFDCPPAVPVRMSPRLSPAYTMMLGLRKRNPPLPHWQRRLGQPAPQLPLRPLPRTNNVPIPSYSSSLDQNCTADTFECPLGMGLVGRNAALNCSFDPCPQTPTCAPDVRLCGRRYQRRKVDLGCNFEPCGDPPLS